MKRHWIAGGDTGIMQTVDAIAGVIRYSIRQPQIRARAEQVIASCPERNEIAEATLLFEWVRDHLRYTLDIVGVETVKSPEVSDAEISERGRFLGDCDDATAYLAALLMAVGYNVQLVVIAPKGMSGTLSHIYLEALLRRSKVVLAMDATAKGYPMGWAAPSERKVVKALF